MGPIKDLFASGQLERGAAHVEALWARRLESAPLKDEDAADVAWLLEATADSPDTQLRLWPRLLGLLTRWAFLLPRTVRSPPGGQQACPSGAATLATLQRWLSGFLASRRGALPWRLQAPALLLLVVAAASPAAPGAAPSSSASPSSGDAREAAMAARTLACEALAAALAASQQQQQLRPGAPPADLLDPVGPGDAVADLCTAAQLVMERLAEEGDARRLADLLAALLAMIAAAVAAAASAGTVGGGGPQAAVVAAAGREAAAVALAALHASCRQLASSVARLAVTAVAAAAPTAAAAAGALAALAQVVQASTARAAAAAVASPALALAPTAAAAAVMASSGPALPSIDRHPWAFLAVASTAAGGFLEGCAAAVRLQPPHLQAAAAAALQPPTAALAAALVAAAGGVAAGWDRPGGAGPQGTVAVAGEAVGYCWARLRLQPPLPGLAVAAAAEQMAAAAARVVPGGGGGSSGGGGWHPARGALAMLMGGGLGLARLAALAATGGSPAAADELLASHSRGPLFADVQALARAVVELARPPPPPPPPAHPAAAQAAAAAQAEQASYAAHLARGLLYDMAVATRQLHGLYGSLADSPRGRAWLAALPLPASAALRELLDRAFVCAVSLLTTAYDTVAPALPPPSQPFPPPPAAAGLSADWAQAEAAAAAETAAMALGALSDVQFCAVQLRIHGELVHRLSTAVALAPSAAAAALTAQMPCYPALAAAYADGGAPVAVSRLAFLLPLAASVAPAAAEAGTAASAVLPYVYLLLKGAPESVVQAAHAVWAALMEALCQDGQMGDGSTSGPDGPNAPNLLGSPEQQHRGILRRLFGGGGGGRGGARPPHGQIAGGGGSGEPACRRGGLAVAEAMVPYYLERTCQPPCSVTDVEALERGLRQAFLSLPLGHPAKAWALARLARQLSAWAGPYEKDAAAVLAAPAPPPSPLPFGSAFDAETAGPAPGSVPLMLRTCVALATLVVLIDFPLLPYALSVLDELLVPPTAAGPGPWLAGDPGDAPGAIATAGAGRSGPGYEIAPPRVGPGGPAQAGGLDGGPGPGLGPMGTVELLGPRARLGLLQALHDVFLMSDDYGRKPLLESWLRRTLGLVAPAAAARESGSTGQLRVRLV
ncbi:hypothetical protein HYH03_005007 [Edaphochlamys debaryana]|uniref:Uncharacterized protein n=1 Tax=Edaphochlamys debaryana TaxID=47281 RepID=A0A835Y915_9CHLO|nr:hypothetical protein HYH03_005007 [Edaphochlamys debaryana]|eukprot:KAG2497003.1 hypothetical protein HYH03_005007 [Edaphochlamys debaryana]